VPPIMKVIGAISTLAAVEAGTLAVTWEDCGAQHATVTDVQPSTISTGTTETITGTGVVDEEVTSAHFSAVVKASGVKVASCEGDATTDIECKLPLGAGKITVKAVAYPLAAGAVSIPVEVTTSSLIPASLAKVDTEVRATEQNGEDVICMNVHTAQQDSAEVETCSGSADPVISDAQCYQGSAGALGLTETVTIKVNDFADSAGHVDLAGDGIESFTCSGKGFTKAGQDIALEDSSDCLPSGIEVTAVKYCSDSDTMKVTVKDTSVPLPISATAKRVDCAAAETEAAFGTCSGDADPVITEAQCYQGKAGALGLTETVTIKVNDFADSAGHVDLAGDGIEAFTCSGKGFTKAGQDIALEDSSDCLPSGIEVTAVKYCSDSDTMKVTVKDTSVPLPISAIATRVDCAAAETEAAFATCSGDADPVITEAQCYQGSAGALGLTETVTIKVNDFADSAGHVDLAGDGIESFTCSGKGFTKAGQDIALEDSSDCLPSGIEVTAVKYCSDSDTMKVTVKDTSVPLPISATAKRVDCAAAETEAAFATCSGDADPVITEAQCYQGKAGALGLTETVTIKVNDFADSAGHVDLAGDGIESFTCSGKGFTKAGQDIALEDSSDCLPSGIEVTAVKYCSDSDTMKVTVKDTSVPLPISAVASRITCPTSIVV